MTDDELRRTAVLIERTDHDAIDRAAAYLRACADALEAGPAAWLSGRVEHSFETATITDPACFNDPKIINIRPLYPLAMPASASDLSEQQYRDMLDADSAPYATAPTPPVATLRLPEPMTKAEFRAIRAAARSCPEAETTNWFDLACRAVESETLRRVKEVNSAVAMPAPLRLPAPMTDEEVDALIDETGHMTTDRAVRYLVEAGERRVKEANE